MNLDLITPIVASVAIFAVVVLAVMLIRQGRALRRLDGRLVEREGVAAQASLERIAVLRARTSLGAGVPDGSALTSVPPGGRNRMLVGGLGLLAVAGLGAAYMLTRDDGAGKSSTSQSTTPRIKPTDPLALPASPPRIDRAAHTIAVLNGTAVSGAAGQVIAPRLAGAGYVVPTNFIRDSGRKDVQETVVMFAKGQQGLAVNIAFDLGIKKIAHLDGARAEGYPGAEAVVIVGQDLAVQGAQGSTTAP